MGDMEEGPEPPTFCGLDKYDLQRLILNLICLWAALCGLLVAVAYAKS